MPGQGIAPAPRRITTRICAPCGRGRYRFHASFRQAQILAFWRLGFRQSGFHHIARISRHAAPYASAAAAGFLACYCPRSPFSDHGSAIRSKDTSSSPCPLRGPYSSAPRGAHRTSVLCSRIVGPHLACYGAAVTALRRIWAVSGMPRSVWVPRGVLLVLACLVRLAGSGAHSGQAAVGALLARVCDPGCDLRPRTEAELVQDAADVAVDGALGDKQACPNLLVGQAVGD